MLDSGAFHESGIGRLARNSIAQGTQPHRLPGSGPVFSGLGLHIANSPSEVTGTPFQSFHLPKKLRRECRFAPETLVAGFAPQAPLHVAGSRFEGTPQDAQLLFIQFEQHHDTPSIPRGSRTQILPGRRES
jgi:hypothetical protein